jgi:choline-sulfatase
MKKHSRPNILFLLSDEHNPTVAGFAGDRVARTSTLDWIAEDGFVFDRAYTPSPICVPARQCILAGQYPRNCGCEGWLPLAPEYRTYARTLSEAGYQSAGFGKMHLVGTDQMQGYRARPCGDVHRSYGPIEKPTPSVDDPQNCEVPLKWSDEKEVRRAGVGTYPDSKDRLAVQAMRLHVDSSITGLWYDRHNRAAPALYYLGLQNPHYPYLTEEPLLRHYLPRVELPRNQDRFDHPFLGRSPWLPQDVEEDQPMGERELLRGRAVYYGKVESMDARAGDALQIIRDAGEDLDEWIIVYASDHGEMIGEHGIWEKQKFFEESARVPLIIRWPAGLGKGRRVSDVVNTIDLFATLCELTGTQTPSGLDSRSLVPLLGSTSGAAAGSDETPRRSYSFFLQQGFRNAMVVEQSLKYQAYFHEERGRLPEVLFDLAADPGETRDLASDPTYAAQLPRLRDLIRNAGYPESVPPQE